MEMSLNTDVEAAATSTSHSNSEIDLYFFKRDPPGLLRHVKREPSFTDEEWLKEEIFEDSSRDGSEQQCVHAAPTLAGAGGVNEMCSTSLSDSLNAKYESIEMDIGTTVLQQMDTQYTINKIMSAGTEENEVVVDSNEAMPDKGVKIENIEDECRDSLTSQKTMLKEQIHVLQSLQHTVQEHRLTSICSVPMIRLHIFQCDLCHAVYTEKGMLLQHLKAEHACHPQTSSFVKCCKTNKQTVADNKATSRNCNQTTREVKYHKAHMKCHQGKQKRLVHQYRTRSSNGYKCDRKFDTPHLLSERDKLHQLNSRKVVTIGGTVSDQSRNKSAKTKRTPFECHICEKGYSSKAALNLHKHSRSSVELKNRLTKFARNSDLNKNIAKKPYQCDTCNARFAQSRYLTSHVRVHTGEKPYQCKICDARFAYSSSLTRHVRVHTGEKPYQCKTCNARFAHSNSFARHMRFHTGEKSHQCKFCDGKFAEKNSLTEHMRVHTGEKPYQCKICDAKFAQNSGLIFHIRHHTGEKPYQCKICHAKFSQSSNLTHHVRVHTGEKPYQCKICDAKFAQKSSLTKHVRVHTGEKPYKCNTCDAKFAQSNNLTVHMRIHTGAKSYRCKTCSARFATNGELTKHVKVHSGKKR